MQVLVINPGSSSIKASIFDFAGGSTAPQTVLDAEVSGIGSPHATFRSTLCNHGSGTPATEAISASNVADAVQTMFTRLSKSSELRLDVVGYRVVHPGPGLHDHQRITPAVLKALQDAVAFAPLHDPVALDAIHVGMERYPTIPHFACFDTVFHQTMPPEASIYPIPTSYRDQGVRRYGFHGLSCESIVLQLRQAGKPLPQRMAIAHLGSGCSVTAVVDGHSVDTTMGMTPTGGIIMGTRPGDLDPGVVLYLLRQQQGTLQEAASAVESMLNHDSGMVAISNRPNNVKDLRTAAADGDAAAMLTLKVFTRRITKALGAFAWLMGGLDAIVFTGGIGQHDPLTRSEVLSGLDPLGVILDTALNDDPGDAVESIAHKNSATEIFVLPAQEDLMIALHVRRMMQAP